MPEPSNRFILLLTDGLVHALMISPDWRDLLEGRTAAFCRDLPQRQLCGLVC